MMLAKQLNSFDLKNSTCHLLALDPVIVLSQQLTDARQTLALAQDQNKLISHEKWELAQEKSKLEGQLKQMQKMITA